MECSKCKENKELMPRRRVCRICYNKEKITQRQKRIPNEREDECRKCFQLKTIPKGKTWCKECKNDYEKLRKTKFNDAKKEEEKLKRQEYYIKIKKNVKEVIVDNTKSKVCSKCKEDKTLDNFFVAKCKGTLRSACKECLSKDRKKYYQNNKQKTNKQTSDYKVKRCKVDPAFKLERTLRNRLYHAFKNQKVDKKCRTKELTGCDILFLKGYLEAKFTEGMSWENHGDWHVDHIRPCCSYDLTLEEEQKKCFHYTNLQPLWAQENLSKGGAYSEVEEVEEINNN
jgi:hypothetical protein